MSFQNSKGTGAGGTSVLMIFVILCLVIFSVLSLVSAQADLRISQNNRTYVENYYKADAAAAKMIGQVDQSLRQAQDLYTQYQSGSLSASEMGTRLGVQSVPGDSAYNMLDFAQKALLTKIGGLTLLSRKNESKVDAILFAVPMDDSRKLSVQLDLTGKTGQDEPRYLIRFYQVVNTADWNIEEQIKVWQGE